MCGIVGLLCTGLSQDELSVAIERMTVTLAHRGPDDSGCWIDAPLGVALGHRRLSILDLSAHGHQPMVSESGRYVISYNGEIYNFRDLMGELVALGAAFRGHSDTEVILAAIEHYGLDGAVRRFVGMFAFALWDRETCELSLVRDRLGIKPLYWAKLGGQFLFASELKALRAYPGWEPELDRDALAAFMRWNYVPAPRSIYKGVSKLEPGCVLRLDADGGHRIERFWDPFEVARQGLAHRQALDPSYHVDELDRRLGEAVRQRMISDVPLGAFLSGGIDSSTVVALMQANSTRPVRTFTIGFADPAFDEARHAKAVAAHLGTDHTEYRVEPEDALNVIPRLPDIYDEPFADSSQIPTFLVSQMTRQDVAVALSGDGGDELFAGYARYHWAQRIWKVCGELPRGLRSGLAGALATVSPAFWDSLAAAIPAGARPRKAGERAVKLASFLSQPDADAVYWRQHTQWENPETFVTGAEPVGVPVDQGRLRAIASDFVERMQLGDLSSYLPNDILTKVDRASMAVSLEVRVPILDHRVVEYSWQLPANLKYRDGDAKWLLRQVLYRYVPRELFDRPKSGFSVPVASWLRGPLRDWAESLLDGVRAEPDGVLAAAPIERCWRQLLAGRDWLETPVWCVLMFLAWKQRHLS